MGSFRIFVERCTRYLTESSTSQNRPATSQSGWRAQLRRLAQYNLSIELARFKRQQCFFELSAAPYRTKAAFILVLTANVWRCLNQDQLRGGHAGESPDWNLWLFSSVPLVLLAWFAIRVWIRSSANSVFNETRVRETISAFPNLQSRASQTPWRWCISAVTKLSLKVQPRRGSRGCDATGIGFPESLDSRVPWRTERPLLLSLSLFPFVFPRRRVIPLSLFGSPKWPHAVSVASSWYKYTWELGRRPELRPSRTVYDPSS